MSARPVTMLAVDYDLPPIEPRQFLVGAAIAVGGVLVAKLVKIGLRWLFARRHTRSYARVFSTLASVLVGTLGIAAGLTVAFPSVRPVDVLGGLGIASIAVGIAFQGILSNMFAGVLILVREPFRSGDQIAVGETRGTVEEVNLRETVVRTFDGRRVLIPNGTVHSEILTVQTGYEHIRTSVCLGVDYATDLAHARRVALEAVRGVDGVAAQPVPDCLLAELAPSTVNFELRFWSGARQLDALETRDRVIQAVVDAYDRERIEMPADIRLLQAGPDLLTALQDGSWAAGDDGRSARQ